MTADAWHRAVPPRRGNAGEGLALIGYDGPSSGAGLGDDPRIGSISETVLREAGVDQAGIALDRFRWLDECCDMLPSPSVDVVVLVFELDVRGARRNDSTVIHRGFDECPNPWKRSTREM